MTDATHTHETVFHVPEGETAYGRRALGNARNLLADESVDAAVAVVANGGGIEHLLSDAPTADLVRELLERGVDVFACGNTIDRSDHDSDEFVDGVVVVPSAMGELTRQQASGAGYVRP